MTTTRPSDLLELTEYFNEKYGDNCLLARLSFDKAVTYFGNKVENLLLERDDNHKPVYNLDDILKEEIQQETVQAKFSKFAGIKGAFRVRKSKVGKKTQ